MKKVILSLIVALSIVSCERSTDTQGPDLTDLFGDFQLLENFAVSANNVDFSNGSSLNFSARFSKTVDWEIHIVGQNSGAEKILSGKTRTIEATDGLWNGTTTNLPMFKMENCDAILLVPEEGYSDTLRNISVDGLRQNDGFVVADFENGINPGWNIFAQSGANMSFNIVASDTSAEQGNYYDMGGQVNWDFLIGLMDFPASAYNSATAFPLSDNGNNVYFNVMLSKQPTINNEIILFQFREDENGDGIFQDQSEDMYALELRSINSEWHLTSVKYSDMTALVNGQPATPAGNGVHEPHKLMQVSVLFLADPASGYSQTLMDYIIFTDNEPLNP